MKKKGFTLIELLVVVLIIGILASIALPQYQKAVEKARAAEAVMDMGVLTQAVDRWVLENGLSSATGNLLDRLDIAMPNTDKFTFYADCYESECNVDIEQVADNFALYGTRDSAGVWTKACVYKTTAGQGVCAGLTGSGYTYSAFADDDVECTPEHPCEMDE